MKDGPGGETELSRQDLYGHYVEQCTEVGPCRDARFLDRAAQYLLRQPEPGGTFTVFPFHQAVAEGSEALSADCRRHLSAFIKAAELLETLCVHLHLQPWRKEIRTLKTFTGPFVYCLLPVFSSSTIQSVLASIGYLPDTDAPQSEFRLSEEANADRAMLVGFELLLARLECYRVLELLDKDQLGPQEWLEVVQRRAQPTKEVTVHVENKATTEQKDEEEEEKKKKKKKGEVDKKEVSLCLDTRLAAHPPPKPRRSHLFSVDQSIMEMQRTYPDLAIRGRPLLPDKPHKALSSVSSSRAVSTAELPRGDGSFKGTRADEVLGDDGRSAGCNVRNSGGTAAPGDAADTDVKRADDELSGPQAISLHLTLRAGAAERQATAEHPAWTQHQAERPDTGLAQQEFPSLSSMDEEQELRRLEERMGQVSVQDRTDEAKRDEDSRRGGESTKRATRKKETKPSSEGEAGLAPSREVSRSTKSSLSEPTATRQQQGEDPESSPAEGEKMAQSFVMVEHHRK